MSSSQPLAGPADSAAEVDQMSTSPVQQVPDATDDSDLTDLPTSDQPDHPSSDDVPAGDKGKGRALSPRPVEDSDGVKEAGDPAKRVDDDADGVEEAGDPAKRVDDVDDGSDDDDGLEDEASKAEDLSPTTWTVTEASAADRFEGAAWKATLQAGGGTLFGLQPYQARASKKNLRALNLAEAGSVARRRAEVATLVDKWSGRGSYTPHEPDHACELEFTVSPAEWREWFARPAVKDALERLSEPNADHPGRWVKQGEDLRQLDDDDLSVQLSALFIRTTAQPAVDLAKIAARPRLHPLLPFDVIAGEHRIAAAPQLWEVHHFEPEIRFISARVYEQGVVDGLSPEKRELLVHSTNTEKTFTTYDTVELFRGIYRDNQVNTAYFEATVRANESALPKNGATKTTYLHGLFNQKSNLENLIKGAGARPLGDFVDFYIEALELVRHAEKSPFDNDDEVQTQRLEQATQFVRLVPQILLEVLPVRNKAGKGNQHAFWLAFVSAFDALSTKKDDPDVAKAKAFAITLSRAVAGPKLDQETEEGRSFFDLLMQTSLLTSTAYCVKGQPTLPKRLSDMAVKWRVPAPNKFVADWAQVWPAWKKLVLAPAMRYIATQVIGDEGKANTALPSSQPSTSQAAQGTKKAADQQVPPMTSPAQAIASYNANGWEAAMAPFKLAEKTIQQLAEILSPVYPRANAQVAAIYMSGKPGKDDAETMSKVPFHEDLWTSDLLEEVKDRLVSVLPGATALSLDTCIKNLQAKATEATRAAGEVDLDAFGAAVAKEPVARKLAVDFLRFVTGDKDGAKHAAGLSAVLTKAVYDYKKKAVPDELKKLRADRKAVLKTDKFKADVYDVMIKRLEGQRARHYGFSSVSDFRARIERDRYWQEQGYVDKEETGKGQSRVPGPSSSKPQKRGASADNDEAATPPKRPKTASKAKEDTGGRRGKAGQAQAAAATSDDMDAAAEINAFTNKLLANTSPQTMSKLKRQRAEERRDKERTAAAAAAKKAKAPAGSKANPPPSFSTGGSIFGPRRPATQF
ncbi:hypothetical protein Rhopal_002938-T1 [Rhodotorula paludigena]|uniref:Uncharacterized protein n=1 Tax=Rhodotorula paludigena TaxID=86838 RepID=A0AAV5GHN0_9BASI|nr:hypothetical protein Rhopal_002938-T1 [Rhodotorula paludigena]